MGLGRFLGLGRRRAAQDAATPARLDPALDAMAARRTANDVGLTGDRIAVLGGRIAGVYMTPAEALRLSVVWACVSVISKGLASCIWDVFLTRADGNRESRRLMAAYQLLNVRPNPETTAFAFREAMLIQALIWGDAFAEIEFDMTGRPAALWLLAPDRCRLVRDNAGNLKLEVQNQSTGVTILDYSEVFHLHGPGVDGISGFEVVSLAARTFAHAAAAERFGLSFYSNGSQMGGVLATDKPMTQDQIDDLRKQVDQRHGGPDKAFRYLLAANGLKFTSTSTTPDDGQFIETRQHEVEEICRWFGVPPHKVQHLLRATFSNIEHLGIEFVRDALVPWAERLAQEADWKLLPDWRGIKTRLDLDWLAEGDAASKAAVDSILVQNGLESRNEARKRRGKNTIGPDGDKLTVQMALTTLDQIGQPNPAPAPDSGDPTQPVARAPGLDNAVRSLLGFAYAKGLRRLQNRATDLWPRAHADFVRAIEQGQGDHGRYVGEEIAGHLQALGAGLPIDVFRDVLIESLSEEPAMLAEAHRRGSLAAWCDIETRAREVADRLADAMKETNDA